ncbi:hypothetical protein DPEC_G00009840 [Dallia pectoralis]|uniref:Uncharacterized protein n=1 Tax=Dallia pectoralis TaxID=75939 RepID=A0ACC2HLJ6_DALPE|nr:hypothetical protein DPEC_G00009840 [Dallia pectoralis]
MQQCGGASLHSPDPAPEDLSLPAFPVHYAGSSPPTPPTVRSQLGQNRCRGHEAALQALLAVQTSPSPSHGPTGPHMATRGLTGPHMASQSLSRGRRHAFSHTTGHTEAPGQSLHGSFISRELGPVLSQTGSIHSSMETKQEAGRHEDSTEGVTKAQPSLSAREKGVSTEERPHLHVKGMGTQGGFGPAHCNLPHKDHQQYRPHC